MTCNNRLSYYFKCDKDLLVVRILFDIDKIVFAIMRTRFPGRNTLLYPRGNRQSHFTLMFLGGRHERRSQNLVSIIRFTELVTDSV